MGRKLRRKRGLELRGEITRKEGRPIFTVFYRFGRTRDWKTLPLVREYYESAEWFSWGIGETEAERQLAFAIAFAYHLKVLNKARTMEIAVTCHGVVDYFSYHISNLPASRGWFLRAKTLPKLFNSKYPK